MPTLDFQAFPSPAAMPDLAAGDRLNCGWIPPDELSRDQRAAHEACLAAMPRDLPVGRGVNENATKVCLWDCWAAHPAGWPGIRQITGSCVGAGGGNALFSLICADVMKRRDPERVEVPFWLLPYGVSRQIGGLRGRGEGSFGSAFAKAAERGFPEADAHGLPPFAEQDGYVWGKETELQWSDGAAIPRRWLDEARKTPVKLVAPCKTADDVRDAIRNYYPVTCASDWGGPMRPPVVEGVLLSRRTTTWMHQMSVQAYWDHPQLGELFWIHNQWGRETHGRCPSGAPGGGFWVRKGDMEYICSAGEVYKFSELQGFPGLSEPLDFSAF